jgi:hypothetical protein
MLRVKIHILLMLQNNQERRIKIQKQKKQHNHQQILMHMIWMINSLNQRNMIMT